MTRSRNRYEEVPFRLGFPQGDHWKLSTGGRIEVDGQTIIITNIQSVEYRGSWTYVVGVGKAKEAQHAAPVSKSPTIKA